MFDDLIDEHRGKLHEEKESYEESEEIRSVIDQYLTSMSKLFPHMLANRILGVDLLEVDWLGVNYHTDPRRGYALARWRELSQWGTPSSLGVCIRWHSEGDDTLESPFFFSCVPSALDGESLVMFVTFRRLDKVLGSDSHSSNLHHRSHWEGIEDLEGVRLWLFNTFIKPKLGLLENERG